MSGTVAQFGVSGQTEAVFSQSNEFLWGGDASRIHVLTIPAIIDGAARDAGNTTSPNVLRPGLLLGRVTATRKLKEWDPNAEDGSEVVAAVNQFELLMTNPVTAQNDDKNVPVIVAAPVKASRLRVMGEPLKGHGSEALARAGLNAKYRFILDDEV